MLFGNLGRVLIDQILENLFAVTVGLARARDGHPSWRFISFSEGMRLPKYLDIVMSGNWINSSRN
jgi:hypothetical protein